MISTIPVGAKVADQRGEALDEVLFAEAEFSLTSDELDAVGQSADLQLPTTTRVVAGRDYNDQLTLELVIPEEDAVRALLEDAGVLDPLERGSLVPTFQGSGTGESLWLGAYPR